MPLPQCPLSVWAHSPHAYTSDPLTPAARGCWKQKALPKKRALLTSFPYSPPLMLPHLPSLQSTNPHLEEAGGLAISTNQSKVCPIYSHSFVHCLTLQNFFGAAAVGRCKEKGKRRPLSTCDSGQATDPSNPPAAWEVLSPLSDTWRSLRCKKERRSGPGPLAP